MATDNVLTEWLAGRFPEVGPLGFYRDLFPLGSIASSLKETGSYQPILVRVIRVGDEPEKAERHFVLDDLGSIRTVLDVDSSPIGNGRVVDLLSPVSYAGRRPRMDMAHELFALAFDLDGLTIDDEGRPVGIEDLFFQMEDLPERPPVLPVPTYVVSSGTGLHLYYLLDEPVRMWPNVCERLRLFRDSFTKRCWNRYVTDLSDEVQLEGVVQMFRMVGSVSKSGDQLVRAFKTGDRVSMSEMDAYVPEECRVAPLLAIRHTAEEARALWPDWDPEWRRKALTAPECPWRVKRDLYDWWCRRVEAGECFEGNRYWCLFVAACYAAKCPDVTYEELSAWAHRVRPVLDCLTKRAGNEFTPEDVEGALSAYDNPISVKVRRDKIAEKTQLPMPTNKRNGRKRPQHLAVMRAIQSVTDPEGNWRNKDGAPTKADLVRSYAAAHPGESHSAIARAVGVSRPTVIKWLKPGWRDEWEGYDPEALGDMFGTQEEHRVGQFFRNDHGGFSVELHNPSLIDPSLVPLRRPKPGPARRKVHGEELSGEKLDWANPPNSRS